MPKISPGRRFFLKAGAAATGMALLPDNIRKALAIPANRTTGTIRDVEHVVLLMQENRSFDHYFGCLGGVRGYGDPRALRLPDGNSVFSQPDEQGHQVLPFRLNTVHTSSACLASLDHSWKGSQTVWNEWNVWVPHKTVMTMGHFTREDIPYYYALAEAFTICDAYHASIFGPTNPNRLYFFTGTSGLAVGNTGQQVTVNVDDGNPSADSTHDNPAFRPFDWKTYPECLQAAGVSWRVYQEYDNFTDNPLQSYATFRQVPEQSWQHQRARRIVPGSNAHNSATSEGRFLVEAFEKDVASGNLPQVSWIVPSQAMSEHPDAPPGYGESLISRLMDVFVRHPDVWAKTVFILNYDENDGFFDHMPAPVPPLTPNDPTQGYCSVSLEGEALGNVPVGLGPRVPAIVISPWTKGGWVNSQLFDHTSVLRFLEARFGVPAPNITPWRRTVCGDLTSVFDFTASDPDWTITLPDTEHYLAETRASCRLPPPVIPQPQAMPKQEITQRPARPLPYALNADLLHDGNGQIILRLANTGAQGAVFQLQQTGFPMRHYTLAAGQTHEIQVGLRDGQTMNLHGPDGFHRMFSGAHMPQAMLETDISQGEVTLTLENTASGTRHFSIISSYAPHDIRTVSLLPRQSAHVPWNIVSSDHWYDLIVTETPAEHVSASTKTTRQNTLRFAGHLQTGRASRTDPLMGGHSA
ncbi:phospholipase C, phosphocholine-specific [Gluconobacter sp. Dm-62]|uniref:phosphocholine-specific phospholipase C n=1 Tax=Gluconobacter sp. Dm-62 TaxID=2799804 RepID=UPI001B8C0252|nr:phospholipase C, phosphocholine-specific [Gluconobacter sp. Dm-62]MBS1101425.1 phospholipase C, phosphocholine-specific [Gluconobacter sp. Dm-62]